MVSVADLIDSQVRTHTYFINEEHAIPVLSLTSDPFNLYDWENGIFVLGPDADSVYPFLGANFWKGIEIPIHFEYFDENKERILEYELGAEVHGGRGARTLPIKPLRLLAKSEFGTEKMEHQFFYNNSPFAYQGPDSPVGHHQLCKDLPGPYLRRSWTKPTLYIAWYSGRPVEVIDNGDYHFVRLGNRSGRARNVKLDQKHPRQTLISGRSQEQQRNTSHITSRSGSPDRMSAFCCIFTNAPLNTRVPREGGRLA